MLAELLSDCVQIIVEIDVVRVNWLRMILWLIGTLKENKLINLSQLELSNLLLQSAFHTSHHRYSWKVNSPVEAHIQLQSSTEELFQTVLDRNPCYSRSRKYLRTEAS